MTLPAYYILIFFAAGTLFPLLGVALGGFLVFRTKKESHESLFPGREKPGEAFNIDEEWEKNIPEAVSQKIPDVVAKAAARFREQVPVPDVAKTLGKEEEKE